jgi:lipoic acid synthetase
MLAYAEQLRPAIPAKSGLMLGLGETIEEVHQVMRDLRRSGVDILTLGQYLRPSLKHLPIIRYVTVEEFADLKRLGYQMGFGHVESGPLVRSSYHAADAVA